MRWLVVVAAVAACKSSGPTSSAGSSGSGSSAAPVIVAPAKPTRLVATRDRTAQLVDIDATSAKTTATIQLPLSASTLVWTGADPIALLVGSGIPDSDDDPKLDGTVGTISAAGFSPLPALPAATWTIPKPRGATHLGPFWKLVASTTDEAWLGRCEWGGIEDGGHCDDWVWARLGGPFPLTSRWQPDEPDALPWPTITAAPGYAITFHPMQDNEYRSILTCKGGGATLTFPTGENDSGFAATSLKWVSTDPPIFVVDQIIDGFEPRPQMLAFEGCAVSKQFENPAAFAGPAGLFALASNKALSIQRNGKQLASLSGAKLVAFAPSARSSDAASPLAIIEKQLAGETSMFAPDALVLAPAPIAAAGVQLVPPGIKSARIDSLTSGTAGDAVWFAAELEIVTAAPTQTYRAVELVDSKTGRVLVASFAPLKPLARVATPPALPSPTTPGPVAHLLADPRSAGVALGSPVAVFGTDLGERATDGNSAQALLGGWGALGLAVDPQVHEVRTATWGYAVATVSLAKPGGPPLRMSALVIATLDKGTWLVAAIHYLSL